MSGKASIPEVRAALRAASGRRLARLLRELEDDDRAGVRALCASASSRLKSERKESRRLEHLYDIESALRAQGHELIVGIDEVGRGCLAGPVTAAAVILPEKPRIEGLDDSKKLPPEKREEVAERVMDIALASCIAHVPPADIDALGMTAAVRRAMSEALAGCCEGEPTAVLVDGLKIGLHPAEQAFVKGDSRVAAIAAASVIAKVARDSLMSRLALDYPGYGFEINKGYSTQEHIRAIEKLGLTDLHRRSFARCEGTIPLF